MNLALEILALWLLASFPFAMLLGKVIKAGHVDRTGQ